MAPTPLPAPTAPPPAKPPTFPCPAAGSEPFPNFVVPMLGARPFHLLVGGSSALLLAVVTAADLGCRAPPSLEILMRGREGGVRQVCGRSRSETSNGQSSSILLWHLVPASSTAHGMLPYRPHEYSIPCYLVATLQLQRFTVNQRTA